MLCLFNLVLGLYELSIQYRDTQRSLGYLHLHGIRATTQDLEYPITTQPQGCCYSITGHYRFSLFSQTIADPFSLIATHHRRSLLHLHRISLWCSYLWRITFTTCCKDFVLSLASTAVRDPFSSWFCSVRAVSSVHLISAAVSLFLFTLWLVLGTKRLKLFVLCEYFAL